MRNLRDPSCPWWLTLSVVLAAFICGIAAAALLAQAQSAAVPPGQSLRDQAWRVVVTELRKEGLAEQPLLRATELRAADFDLPASLPSVAGRHLRLQSVCWDETPHRLQFRLLCQPGECLPFVVYLRVEAASQSENAARAQPSCRLRSEPHPLNHASRQPQPQTAQPSPLVRAGERATAVFLADHLRMSAAVTCLDRGQEGDVIRVRTQNGQILRARISGPDLLEALPE